MKKLILVLTVLLATTALGQSGNSGYPTSSLAGFTGHALSGPLACPAASGSGTAYTCSIPNCTAPADGDVINFQADVANTGPATLNECSSSAAPIQKQQNGSLVPLIANDFGIGQDCLMEYDGANWQMQCMPGNPSPALPAVTNTTAVTVTGPTIATDTIMMGLSLPAAYLNTPGQPFIVHGSGVLTTLATTIPAVTITPKICSVAGCGSGTVTPLAAIQSAPLNTAGLTNSTWAIDLTMTVVANGASCNFIVKGSPGLVIDTSATLGGGDTLFADTNTAVSSPNQNCANALFLDFFVQQSTTGASNVYKQLEGVIAPPSGVAGSSTSSGCMAACSFVVASKSAVGVQPGNGAAPGNTVLYTHFYRFYNDVTQKLGTTCLTGVQTLDAALHYHVGVYSISGATATLQWDCGQQSTATVGQVANTSVTAYVMNPGAYAIVFCSDTITTFVPYVLMVTNASQGGTASFVGGSNTAHNFGIDSTDVCTAAAAALPATITTTNLAFTAGTTVVDVPYTVSVNP